MLVTMENLQLDANELKSPRNHALVVLLLTAVLVSLSALQYLLFFLLTKLSDLSFSGCLSRN